MAADDAEPTDAPGDIGGDRQATLFCPNRCWAVDYRGQDPDQLDELGAPIAVRHAGDHCPYCGSALHIDWQDTDANGQDPSGGSEPQDGRGDIDE